MKKIIVVAGGTGNLGTRILTSLLQKGADVRVLARASSDPEKLQQFEKLGATIAKVNQWQVEEISKACQGASCVVSVLAGLEDVIIDAQKILLDGAVAAGVPRFIPSDYAIDFTRIPGGGNRNLDLRRRFHQYLDKAPIKATTIFNGPFADMLTGQMPLVLFKQKRILCWGNPDQLVDFTTMDDTAAFTASAALDDNSPRFLRIAGDQISPRGFVALMRDLTGEPYKLFRPGGLGLLSVMIKIARTFSPGKNELYPAWQGMQYMRDMMDGRGKVAQVDNDRYPDMHWTTARDVLAAHLAQEA